MLGIRTQGRRMVGADETTELWRQPIFSLSFFVVISQEFCDVISTKTHIYTQRMIESYHWPSLASLSWGKKHKPGDSGLVVMGGDSRSECREFESQHCILDVIFTLICSKICIAGLKKTENKRKRAHLKNISFTVLLNYNHSTCRPVTWCFQCDQILD